MYSRTALARLANGFMPGLFRCRQDLCTNVAGKTAQGTPLWNSARTCIIATRDKDVAFLR